MRILPLPLTVAATLTLTAALTPLFAQAQTTPVSFTHTDGTPYTTDEKIDALQQQLNTLKSQRDLDQELATRAAAKTPVATLDKKGLKFVSSDGKYELAINAQVNIDARNYSGDGGAFTDDVLARLIRPTISGKAGNGFFRITPEFAGSSSSSASLVDGYIGYKFSDAAQIQAGKFKSPIGLERLQSAADIVFTERGHSTNLVPNRDSGVQLSGNLIPNVLEYQIGVFDGAADNANIANDSDNQKDIAYRFFATPFSQSGLVWLQGFGIGWAGSTGKHLGNTTTTQLASYKTPGQQTFFKFSGGVFANGRATRSNPEAYLYLNNFGLLVDYVESKQQVASATKSAELTQSALDISGSWVLTGESVSFKGGVKPAHDFILKDGGWGALELVARYGYTDVDNVAFTDGFASISVAASKATSTGVGLGWYWSENVKLLLDYDQTRFDGGAAGGADRATENFTSAAIQFRY